MIRNATETDLPGILEIYNDAILNTTAVYTYHAQTLEERQEWFHRKLMEGFPVLVYEADRQVTAFATFGLFRPHPAYKYTIEDSVYVRREYRGKGIGKAMLEEVIELATAREYATLVAGIDAANQGSIKMHESMGFKYTGRINRAGFKFGKWLDLLFYQLELVGPKHPVEG